MTVKLYFNENTRTGNGHVKEKLGHVARTDDCRLQ